MKKIKIWSMMMLVAMTLPMMVACGGDDDNNNNNGSTYSSDEIVELLTGKWDIAGDFIISDTENKQLMSGTYTGNIEFNANQKFTRSIKVTVDGNESEATEEDVRKYLTSVFINNYYPYQILKKGGKNYICFDKTYNFEIRSLNKTTFYFEMDQDLMSYSGEKVEGHIYMTMVSK